MEHNLTHDSYYANINRINRFLTRDEEYGYGFAIAEHAAIIPNINRQLIEKASTAGKIVRNVFIDPQSDVPFVQQLRNAIHKTPIADVLIINNIGAWLPQKENGLTEAAQTFLLGLNFSREAIHNLKIPILFWLTKIELSAMGMLATDFFSQRQISTVYFHDSPDIYVPDLILEKHLITDTEENNEEDYQRLLLKINLLKKQLKEAVENDYPFERVRVDIALPLAKAYADSKLYREAIELLDKYLVWEIPNNRRALLECARIYLNAKEYEKAKDIYLMLIDVSESKQDLLLGFAYGELGIAYLSENNDSKAAFEYHEKAIRLNKKLYESDAQSEQLTNGLSVAYINIARAYRIKHEYEKAIDYYTKGLKLIETLYTANPEYKKWTQKLGTLYEDIGDFYLLRSLIKEALDFYLKSSLLKEELFASSHGSAQSKSTLAGCYMSIGRIYYRLNDKRAYEYLIKAFKLREELYITYPSSETAKCKLASVYLGLGDFYENQQLLSLALEYYKKNESLLEELSAVDSEKWKNELSQSFDRFGRIYEQLDIFDDALNYYTRAAQVKEELYDANPNRENIMYQLGTSYVNLGNIQKKHSDALAWYNKAIEVYENFYAMYPESKFFISVLLDTYIKIGDFYLVMENDTQAFTYYMKSVELNKALIVDNPASDFLKYTLSISYCRIGDVFEQQNALNQALHYYNEELELVEEITRINPDIVLYKEELADVLLRIGLLNSRLGHTQNAREQFENAKAIWLSLSPDNQLSAYEEKLREVVVALARL